MHDDYALIILGTCLTAPRAVMITRSCIVTGFPATSAMHSCVHTSPTWSAPCSLWQPSPA